MLGQAAPERGLHYHRLLLLENPSDVARNLARHRLAGVVLLPESEASGLRVHPNGTIVAMLRTPQRPGAQPSPTAATALSYDRIADDYVKRNRDRSAMAPAMDRFAAQLAPGALVVDVGCGPGFDGVLLRQRGLRVIGVDLSAGMLATARELFPGVFVQGDLRRLPLSRRADGLWVNASLLHVPRDEVPVALEGFAGALRPGGVLFVSVKAGDDEGWEDEPAYGDPRWFTYWTEDALDAALASAGFTVTDGRTNPSPLGLWILRVAHFRGPGSA